MRSTHVFAFSGRKKLLLNESDGKFSYDEWAEAYQLAESVCCGVDGDDEGGVKLDASEVMDIDGQTSSESLDRWLREVVRKKVEHEQRWKTAT